MKSDFDRLSQLLEAEHKAKLLFLEIEKRGIIKPGITEKEVNEAVFKLGFEMFGVKKHWHKRIVRAGENTLQPYRENPPNLTIKQNDIVFLDFGPVFEEWEADFGRTYVLGTNSEMFKIKNDCETIWYIVKNHFDSNPQITANQLFDYSVKKASEFGWEFGGPIAGHLIGEFPHEKIYGEEIKYYIHPSNPLPLNHLGENKLKKFWILEIHLVDRKNKIGAFFEQILNF
jgi:Xaa-Pro dipeptidase